MSVVELKQYADESAAAIGLDKHNRSKLPGTFEIVYPAKGTDGRWITGIDEKSIEINSIKDPVLREKRREEILEARTELEALTNLDLSATNDEFWQKFRIVLKDNFSLDLANPIDKLKYHVLISNKYAAPEIGVIESPDFFNTKYYVSRKEEEVSDRVITRRIKDEAKAKLLALSENYNKLVLIARYLLGVRRIKDGQSPDSIYEELSLYIDNPKDKSNVSNFLNAVDKGVESLQFKLVVDEAIRRGIIKVRDGLYQRGNATYGKSLKETVEYLSAIENSSEFASLKEETEE